MNVEELSTLCATVSPPTGFMPVSPTIPLSEAPTNNTSENCDTLFATLFGTHISHISHFLTHTGAQTAIFDTFDNNRTPLFGTHSSTNNLNPAYKQA